MFLLFACAAPEDTSGAGACEGFVAPILAVSATELDFGVAVEGDVVERTLEIRNDGGHPLGITGVRIGDEQPEFAAELGDAECTWAGVGVREEQEIGEPWDSAPTYTAEEVPVTVLEPGCVVPVTVRYTASRRPKVLDALVVESPLLKPEFDDDGATLWRPDYRHRWRVVWLSAGAEDGDDTGASEDDSRIVGDIVSADPTDVIEGEASRLEARTWGEGAAVSWTSSAESNPFDSLHTLVTTFREVGTQPGCVPGAGHFTSVYVISSDALGGQDWTFGKVAVWDETTPLACPVEPLPCSEAEECTDHSGCGDCPSEGCGGGAAIVGLSGMVGWGRRRRGSQPVGTPAEAPPPS